MRRKDQRPGSGPSGTPLEPVLAELERAVAGGVVLGRDGEGRVVLARGGLPGERVVVAPERVRAKLVTGTVTSVELPSAQRVEPPCPKVALGCGGCDLQHGSRELQGAMRTEVLRDALAHTGSLPGAITAAIPIDQLEPPPVVAGRTTMRLAVCEDGSLGLRRHHSHEPLAVPDCLVAHPALLPALSEARFPGAREVTLRASEATGEVLAVVSPRMGDHEVPEGVRVVGADALEGSSRARATRAWITEEVNGQRFRVSARAFFQSGPVAAGALGRAVSRALDGFDPVADALVDLYGGVGLFTVLLGARRAEVVERSSSAVADARVNTADLGARVTRASVEEWKPSRADAVVADPARQGLGAAGSRAVAATGATRVALVSCDPAAMARDLSLLHEAGYVPTRIEVVDAFPHTHHIEAVTTLRRESVQ